MLSFADGFFLSLVLPALTLTAASVLLSGPWWLSAYLGAGTAVLAWVWRKLEVGL